MKGQNDKLRNKSFYVWMLSGVLVVVCICAVCFNIASIDNKNNATDQGKPIAENITDSNEPVQQDQETASDQVQGEDVTKAGSNLLENDIVDAKEEQKAKDDSETAQKNDTDSVEAMSGSKSIVNSLSFDEEKGLSWPVSGNVIMNYSADKAVLFATLGSYKCNPAVVIGAEEGSVVKSAAKGVVEEISENEETGLTLKMSIGSDYTLTYGQLKDVSVKEGDVVESGAEIGKIAAPSKYYVVEGANLYFQVKQGDSTVNPMYLLN